MKAARELGVRAVLTGRMLKRGDNLMVSAELLDVRDNKQVWGEQYNGKVADALAAQQEISREIFERLHTKLSGEEQNRLKKRDTTDPEAFQAYLRGRYYWNKRTAENIAKAMEQFQQASDRDPNYALAYAGLGDCYMVLGDYSGAPTNETLPKAKAFVQRALQLDPSLGEAHATLANTETQLWQWQNAEEEFKNAIKLNPNYPSTHHWYYLLLAEMGRANEALAEIKRAQDLDPVSQIIGANMATAYLTVGDVNTAMEQAKRLIDLDPTFPRAHETAGLAYLKEAHYPEAVTELEKSVDLSARRDRNCLRNLGYCYAIAGKRTEALGILKEVQANYDKHLALAADLAAVYAGLGQKDEAFAWLERGFQARAGNLASIRWQAPFESLRSDRRFAELLRRMGIPP
jgi:Flp pilus assembly protein TadD